jgi:hypothetical protein
MEGEDMNRWTITSLILGFVGLAVFVLGMVQLNSDIGQGADISAGMLVNSGNLSNDYIAKVGTAFSILGMATGYDSILIAVGFGFISVSFGLYAIYISFLSERSNGELMQAFTSLHQTITQQYALITSKLDRFESAKVEGYKIKNVRKTKTNKNNR